MELVQLGTIVKSVGLNGELKIHSTTSFAEIRYKKGNTVYVGKDINNLEKYKVMSFRHESFFDFVYLEGIKNIDDATKYLGFAVFSEKLNKNMPKDTYYYDDLKGCKILDSKNNALGIVTSVEEFPGQINLAVKSNKDNKIYYIPFIERFILTVDIEQKIININLIDGLLG